MSTKILFLFYYLFLFIYLFGAEKGLLQGEMSTRFLICI